MPAITAPVRRRRRRHLATFVLTSALTVLAVPQARAQAPASHTSTPSLPASSGVLAVNARPRGAAAPDSDALLLRRIQTHAVTLASEHHLRRVLENPNSPLRGTQWFKSTNDAAERTAWLRKHLRIAAVPGTSLIELALPDSVDPGDRKAILQKVGNAYLAEVGQVAGGTLLDRTSMLNALKNKAESRLTTLRQELQELGARANTGDAAGLSKVKEIQLAKMVGEQVDASAKASKVAAEHQAAATAVREGRDPADLQKAVRRLAPYLAAEEREIAALELEAAVARQQFGEENPRYKATAKRLEVMRATFQKKSEEVKEKACAAFVEELEDEHTATRAQAELISKRVEQLKGELAEAQNAAIRYGSLKEEERALRDQVRQIKEQIDNAVTTHQHSGTADIHWHLLPEAVPTR